MLAKDYREGVKTDDGSSAVKNAHPNSWAETFRARIENAANHNKEGQATDWAHRDWIHFYDGSEARAKSRLYALLILSTAGLLMYGSYMIGKTMSRYEAEDKLKEYKQMVSLLQADLDKAANNNKELSQELERLRNENNKLDKANKDLEIRSIFCERKLNRKK